MQWTKSRSSTTSLWIGLNFCRVHSKHYLANGLGLVVRVFANCRECLSIVSICSLEEYSILIIINILDMSVYKIVCFNVYIYWLVGRTVTYSLFECEVWSSNLRPINRTQCCQRLSSVATLLGKELCYPGALTRTWAPQTFSTLRCNTANIMKDLIDLDFDVYVLTSSYFTFLIPKMAAW